MKTKINYKNINTLDDLRTQIMQSKVDYKVRGEMLKTDSKNYVNQYSVHNLVKKYINPSELSKFDEQTHISSKIMSIALPMILNATVFRGSGLITKAVGALVSRKVGKSLDVKHITGAFKAVKSIFTGRDKKKKDAKFIDYGIPPDSETY